MNTLLKRILVLAWVLMLLLTMPLLDKPQDMVSAQSSATNRILFESGRDGNGEIYVMNANGSSQTRLTNSSGYDAYASWSPDGTKIVFGSNRSGNYEIYTMNANGSNQTRLTNNTATDMFPYWSPDGMKIAFTSNRDGNWEIYLMNPDGSNQTNITNNAATDDHASWSLDGMRLLFYSSRNGNNEIYVMNADGSSPTRITSNTVSDAYPAWSPDDTKIAFQSDRDGNNEIYIMNADGSGQTRLTNNTADDEEVTWSPDGTKLAFTSNRSGNYEVYLMNPDGSNLTNITNNAGHDIYPHWYTPAIGGSSVCRTTAPTTVDQGSTFTLTLACGSISGSVFGFQAGHTITAGSALVTTQASSYTAGTIFQGQSTLAGSNTLSLYALSLQAGGTQATGSFTLGSVIYTANSPGLVTFNLTNLILGDIQGHALPNVTAANTSVTVTIGDLVLSLSGTVAPESYADANSLTLVLAGNPAYTSLQKTFNAADGTTAFSFTNLKGHPSQLTVDGPGHVACQKALTFPVDADNEVLPNPLVLRAGDVNGDNLVDIVDATALGQGYGLAPTGELDINHDGAVNILDLIHVGRNYGTSGPTDCTPAA